MSTTSPRTNYDKVQAVMSVTLDRKTTEALITSANLIVTSNLANEGLSSTLLAEIETYLTAHLLSTTVYRQVEQEKLGDGSVKYAKLGEALKSSTYGQIALQLDSSGVLATIGKQKPKLQAIASFTDSEVLS